MKGLYFDGEKAVYREDLPKPVCGEGESLIRILMAAICNTDREVLKGYRPDFRGVMGHEFVGVVERSEDESLIGKRVVGELNAGCGHCLYCRTGREKHCPDRKVIGMEGKDGCFAEYMTLQTHLIHRVPEELPTEKAIFTEPLAAAFEITSQVHISPDTKVAVLGDMGELGASSWQAHQDMVDFLVDANFDHVWLVGHEFKATHHPFRTFDDVEQVKRALAIKKPRGYNILIKGSHSTKLYELREYL